MAENKKPQTENSYSLVFASHFQVWTVFVEG